MNYSTVLLEVSRMMRVVILGIVVAVLTGCASNVREKARLYNRELADSSLRIERLEKEIESNNDIVNRLKERIRKLDLKIKQSYSNIERAKIQLSKSRKYLKDNPDVYIGGKCVMPQLGKKPSPFCESMEEARKFSLAYCSMSVGCDAAILLAGDELDTFSKRFLASESCSRMVAELKGEGYSPNSTVVNAFEALSDTACSSDSTEFFSAIFSGIGCLMSASIKLSKIRSYVNCVDREAKACYSRYVDWKTLPKRRKEKCMINVRSISDSYKVIKASESNIYKNKKLIKNSEKKIVDIERRMVDSNKELVAEQMRNQKYRRLLDDLKKTFSYKVYVK